MSVLKFGLQKIAEQYNDESDLMQDVGITGAGLVGGNVGQTLGYRLGEAINSTQPTRMAMGPRGVIRGIKMAGPESLHIPSRAIGGILGILGAAGLAHLVLKRHEQKTEDPKTGDMSITPESTFPKRMLPPVLGMTGGALLGEYIGARHGMDPLARGLGRGYGALTGLGLGAIAAMVMKKMREKKEAENINN